MPRIRTTRTLECFTSELTVGLLRSFTEGQDPEALVRISSYAGDRPGERATVTLTVADPR